MLIDITRLIDRKLKGRLATGVDRVSLEYIRHFRGDALALVRHAGRWVMPRVSDSQRLFDALLVEAPDFAWVVHWCVGKGHVLGCRHARGMLLLNTGHSGLDDWRYAREIARRELRPVFFLHDLIPLAHPQYCRAGEPERHRRRLQTMLELGKGLIVNSRNTGDELKKYSKAMGYDVPPNVVAPLAPARLAVTSGPAPIDAPYFVMLGTIEPRKNHGLMIDVWRQLAVGGLDAPPRLVVIGQQGWDVAPVMQALRNSAATGGLIQLEEHVRDEDLAAWLLHARALLFPSLAEGFGMPLVEALSAGTPVIASDLPAFREIAGDIPHYIDPRDAVAWLAAILDYAKAGSAPRQAQLARMRGFQANTWDQHFALVRPFVEALG